MYKCTKGKDTFYTNSKSVADKAAQDGWTVERDQTDANVSAFLRRRRERQSPRWKLAAAAAIEKLPLNGSCKVFAQPSGGTKWQVLVRDYHAPHDSPASWKILGSYRQGREAENAAEKIKQASRAKYGSCLIVTKIVLRSA